MVRRRRLLREIAIGAGAFVGFIVIVQLLYPSGRSLPFASVEGVGVGYKTTAEIGPVLQSTFEKATVHTAADRLSVDAKLSLLGAELDVDKTAAQLTEYPWWQRVLPFSIFWVRPDVEQLSVTFDETQLADASASLAKKLTADSVNGTVTIDAAGAVVLTASKNGVTTTKDEVEKAITGANFTPGTSQVVVTATVHKPTVTNSALEKAKAKITTAIARTVSIKDSISGATYTPDSAAIASWIAVGDDLSLSLDASAVAAYANSVGKAQLVSAGVTKVTVVDGIEKSRTVGSIGRGVDVAALVTGLTKVVLGGTGSSVTMNYAALQPTVSYDRSYTNSQAALQAYIDDVTSGGNIEIAVTQLDGAGWSASSGASKSVVSASTYKLFVSLLLFDKLSSGQLSWSSTVAKVGTSVETCLYNTIIYSANNCAEQWISEWGRSAINSALYAKGFSSATTFTTSDAVHTSAQDLRTLLLGLYNKTLFSASDASRLLSLMKSQVYRSGIPAGSAGTVADKVGFLWDYLNDAAIVYHPRGTYVLVIMTKGESWDKIAEITKQIEKIMYP